VKEKRSNKQEEEDAFIERLLGKLFQALRSRFHAKGKKKKPARLLAFFSLHGRPVQSISHGGAIRRNLTADSALLTRANCSRHDGQAKATPSK
jgi:hypothetical protein